MNEFKFLSEKNIDHNIAHDHYIYEEFFLCIFKKKNLWMTVHFYS